MSEENRTREEIAKGIIQFIAGAIENWENASLKDLLKMMADTQDQGLRLLLFKCISADCDINQLNRDPLPFGKRIKELEVTTNEDATAGVITATFEDGAKMYYLVKMVNGMWKLWVEPSQSEALEKLNTLTSPAGASQQRRPMRRTSLYQP